MVCFVFIAYVLGGAGGKGVWGKPGSELDAPEVMDEKDPNYDSDSLDNGDVTLEAIVPTLSLEEIHKHLEPVILEYYSHGDTREVRTVIRLVSVSLRNGDGLCWLLKGDAGLGGLQLRRQPLRDCRCGYRTGHGSQAFQPGDDIATSIRPLRPAHADGA